MTTSLFVGTDSLGALLAGTTSVAIVPTAGFNLAFPVSSTGAGAFDALVDQAMTTVPPAAQPLGDSIEPEALFPTEDAQPGFEDPIPFNPGFEPDSESLPVQPSQPFPENTNRSTLEAHIPRWHEATSQAGFAAPPQSPHPNPESHPTRPPRRATHDPQSGTHPEPSVRSLPEEDNESAISNPPVTQSAQEPDSEASEGRDAQPSSALWTATNPSHSAVGMVPETAAECGVQAPRVAAPSAPPAPSAPSAPVTRSRDVPRPAAVPVDQASKNSRPKPGVDPARQHVFHGRVQSPTPESQVRQTNPTIAPSLSTVPEAESEPGSSLHHEPATAPALAPAANRAPIPTSTPLRTSAPLSMAAPETSADSDSKPIAVPAPISIPNPIPAAVGSAASTAIPSLEPVTPFAVRELRPATEGTMPAPDPASFFSGFVRRNPLSPVPESVPAFNPAHAAAQSGTSFTPVLGGAWTTHGTQESGMVPLTSQDFFGRIAATLVSPPPPQSPPPTHPGEPTPSDSPGVEPPSQELTPRSHSQRAPKLADARGPAASNPDAPASDTDIMEATPIPIPHPELGESDQVQASPRANPSEAFPRPTPGSGTFQSRISTSENPEGNRPLAGTSQVFAPLPGATVASNPPPVQELKGSDGETTSQADRQSQVSRVPQESHPILRPERRTVSQAVKEGSGLPVSENPVGAHRPAKPDVTEPVPQVIRSEVPRPVGPGSVTTHEAPRTAPLAAPAASAASAVEAGTFSTATPAERRPSPATTPAVPATPPSVNRHGTPRIATPGTTVMDQAEADPAGAPAEPTVEPRTLPSTPTERRSSHAATPAVPATPSTATRQGIRPTEAHQPTPANATLPPNETAEPTVEARSLPATPTERRSSHAATPAVPATPSTATRQGIRPTEAHQPTPANATLPPNETAEPTVEAR
ncbi:MAG: hypothetical protein AB7J34_00425, partial [Limisphaerales bacterium]